MLSITFEAIGTRWDIALYDAITPSISNDIRKKIRERIDAFDKAYSRFRDDSMLMQLSHQPGRYKLPSDAKPLFDFYQSLYEITEGKVTPLIGNMLDDAGYDAAYSLKLKSPLSASSAWDKVINYEYPYISNIQSVILDVGAAGKGYLVDIIGGLLQEAGLSHYLIDAGGDMLFRSATDETIRIGLEHPQDPSLAIGVVQLGNESICGSAGNRRSWAGLHHIMDPGSALPVQAVVATWAVAMSAMVADGMATALFFTPAKVLKEHFAFEYIVVRSDMSLESSPGLRAELFGESDA